MLNGYIHAAIDYQWLGLDRLACIVSGSVPVGYAAKYSSVKIDIAARLAHPTARLISGQLRYGGGVMLNRLAGILSRRVPVAYAAQIISCPKQSAYGGYFLMSNNTPHWNKAENHG